MLVPKTNNGPVKMPGFQTFLTVQGNFTMQEVESGKLTRDMALKLQGEISNEIFKKTNNDDMDPDLKHSMRFGLVKQCIVDRILSVDEALKLSSCQIKFIESDKFDAINFDTREQARERILQEGSSLLDADIQTKQTMEEL